MENFDFQMASLDEAFLLNPRIGANHLYSEGRITIPIINSRSDISGTETYLHDLEQKRNQLIEIDQYTLHTDIVMNKFKSYKSAYEENQRTIYDISKKIDNINKEKEEYLKLSSIYHNSLLSFFNFPKEIYDSLTKQTNDLRELENKMREELLENLGVALRKSEQEIETNLYNMNKLRDCISAGIKAILPGGELKQNMCTICLEKEINTCVVPCGHTFCEGCILRSMDTYVSLSVAPLKGNCPTCRFSIEKTIKIYLN